ADSLIVSGSMENASRWRWVGPLATLAVMCSVFYVLHRQLGHVRLREVGGELRAIPNAHILAALALMAANYWVLSAYVFLALRYLQRKLHYLRIVFTSFIAYAFAYNLGFSVLTGAAVRFRLYSPRGLTAADVATMAAFCSITTGLGLATLGGLSLILEP